MSADIGPGDVVECVFGQGQFTVGSLYHVREVTPEYSCTCMAAERPWAFKHVGLLFGDAQDPPVLLAWCSLNFRPISRRSDFEAILEQLKKTPCDVSEPSELVPATA